MTKWIKRGWRSQGCYQVSDFPKYKIWGGAAKFSFRHVNFEKPRGNTNNYIDFCEVIGMEVIT